MWFSPISSSILEEEGREGAGQGLVRSYGEAWSSVSTNLDMGSFSYSERWHSGYPSRGDRHCYFGKRNEGKGSILRAGSAEGRQAGGDDES